LGIEKIHEYGMIHCDIKPSNIIINNKFSQAKIIDLGSAVQCGNLNTKNVTQREHSVKYSAFEVLFLSYADFKSDVWSLGCIIFEMVTGHKAWHDEQDHFQKSILHEKKNILDFTPDKYFLNKDWAKPIIQGCF
jgi:serine/threonine protein kinase